MRELSTVSGCRACHLRAGCGQVVAGCGGNAKVVFVGEQPDAESDLLGEPFSDRAGRHLRELLERAGLADAYRTYAVKCMGESDAASAAACKGWLWAELTTLKPAVVVTMGAGPTRLLLKLPKRAPLKPLVGRFHAVEYMAAAVAPWYSPSYLLQRGKATDAESANFLRTISERSTHVQLAERLLRPPAGAV